ncbi:hypothetical protein SARC_02015 [Sphaeroforma arctica JP610]|uniref:Aldehyde dehydrogenase n=1 Tax=Sphaeroforma arctica JP610 TaxID=667725 RepID=A0A0L0G9X2_9EUKA|nr:hypothetical protein SARC_02015 [Sphaeroforma arctica JP610]KNC85832.1 hypothetical protein SARC_02015 [Sphaeroforma arctica JP610]|eukprot:XP_014159734.1 hypothetical protein SARC_02015 [Sphaeroforma arctica JP610]
MSKISSLAQKVTNAFKSGRTQPLEWRKSQLTALRSLLVDNETRILNAVQADLGKCHGEGWLVETQTPINSIDQSLAKIDKWVKPRVVHTDMMNFPAKSMIYPEPLGTALIVGCWNYPITLIADPLVAAITAGNSVVIKTGSEDHAKESMKVLVDLIPKYMDPEAIGIVDGGYDVLQDCLKERWDIVFATGSPNLGRLVAEHCVPHLTKAILELGGKSPVYVGRNAKLDTAAKRIVWASLGINAGQTCIRPDHLFVDNTVADEFIEHMKREVVAMYGENPKESPEYGRIAKVKSFYNRLIDILQKDSKYIVHGGDFDASQFYIQPTIMDFGEDSVAYHKSAAMSDEIFGPILPVLRVSNADEAIESILTREKPLALYAYTNDEHVQEKFMKVSAGTLQFNDSITFMMNHDLPFGGVGNSGCGKYHGEKGFEEFSHMKSVLVNTNLNDLPSRFAPQTSMDMTILGAAHRHMPEALVTAVNNLPAIGGVGVVAGLAYYCM